MHICLESSPIRLFQTDCLRSKVHAIFQLYLFQNLINIKQNVMSLLSKIFENEFFMVDSGHFPPRHARVGGHPEDMG